MRGSKGFLAIVTDKQKVKLSIHLTKPIDSQLHMLTAAMNILAFSDMKM